MASFWGGIAMVIVVLISCIALVGSFRAPEEAYHPPKADLDRLDVAPVTSGELQSLSMAHSGFGLELFQKVTPDASTGNVFMSPLSVAMAMAMCARGASGAGLQELRATLRIDNVGDEGTVSRAYRQMLSIFGKADPAVTITLANSAWARPGNTFKPDYLAALEGYYHAEAHTLSGVGPLNAWVAEKTNGMIKSVVNDLPRVAFMLINVVYFKAAWQYKFDPKRTRQMDFNTPQGPPKKVHMMFMKRPDFLYHETKQWQMVKLPYGEGADYAAFVVLPKEGHSLQHVISALTPEAFARPMKKEGTLWLPRLKMEYSTDLSTVLQAMGIKAVFRGNGLSRVADGPLQVDRVLHKAVVELDEEGTEAAAVTAVTLTRSLPIPGESFFMKVDRPFVFVLRHNGLREQLFLGRIHDPQP
uniref:Serpin domain-containing protein n=1 Tax=Eutreptiella gymnastica TaxID=73025 RepID=A0A7S4GHR5_9EUGL